MLLFASIAVMVTPVIAVPAVWGLLMLLNVKWSRAPGLTVKLPLVPDLPEPDVEIVIPEPAPVNVTEPVQTPLEKAPVVVGLMVPVETLKVFVPT